ncbi:hypothetical protein F5B22DRAFT_616614 [Xylaria bambusicola]|uniref:uncharacterized protein n=1 Tax=Xylaria bambusicola TaxID=326684 RepID=UPI00200865AE|nr:uncharacterized protein F5B22DRAFT_616614 [Xylaria bambusicola]KAI0509525.1 hypothetical protein F5B22DRAFT_616614 [Xylaria bambusicola]
MRLINVTTKTLENFDDDTKPIPPYAILSHTWGPDHEEISYQELQNGAVKKGLGKYKFDKCCAEATHDGLSYAWIDTCCIDKTNSAELSEAINSMFKWYKDAQVCYAYLCDVDEYPSKPQTNFRKSRWFQRGWTLQELIAPKIVHFFDRKWNHLGQKRDLSLTLVEVTKIPRVFLLGIIPLHEASVAQRMSWASDRVTKRKEDLAYCLLGIFGITMPMIYGEGDQAFIRLQEEITRHINDDSILAWNFQNPGSIVKSTVEEASGCALASSPSSFANSSHIVPCGPKGIPLRPLQTLGGCLLLQRPLHTDSHGQCFVVLECQLDYQADQAIGIPVQNRPVGYDDYIRLHEHPSVLLPRYIPEYSPYDDPGDIRILNNRFGTHHDENSHSFYIENALENNLKLIRVTPRSSWDRERDILIPNEETRYGQSHRLWLKFQHQQNGAEDFVLILELILMQIYQPEVRYHVMTCDKGADLSAIKRDFSHFSLLNLNKHSASNGILGLKATVSRQKVGKKDLFVVRLLPSKNNPDTYNVTRVLQSLTHEHLTRVEEIRRLKSRFEPLARRAETKGEGHNSRKADSLLPKDKTTTLNRRLSNITLRAGAGGREIGLTQPNISKELCNVLPSKTRAPQVPFDEHFVERAEKMTDKMLKRVPFDEQHKYNSEPDPVNKFSLVAARIGEAIPFRQLAKKATNVHIAAADKSNLLTSAVLGRNRRNVQVLLSLGVGVEEVNATGYSALHYACMRGPVDIVRLLLEHGANIEKKNMREWTPLMLAASHGEAEIVQELVDRGANIYAVSRTKQTALMKAAGCGHNTVVKKLIKYKATIKAKDNLGRTALFHAAEKGHCGIVETLIKDGANLEAMDYKGTTALMLAAYLGQDAVVTVLIENGAEIEKEGVLTARACAMFGGHSSTVNLLDNLGSNGNGQRVPVGFSDKATYGDESS